MNQYALKVVIDPSPFQELNSTADGLEGAVSLESSLSRVSPDSEDLGSQENQPNLVSDLSCAPSPPGEADYSAHVLALAERVERNRANQSTADLTIRLSELLLLPSTDLFPQSRALIDDTLSELLPALDVPTKRQIAHRVAGLGEAPGRVLHKLLMDDISVARPILQKRKDIPDHVMLDVARQTGKEHRQAIASMRHLSGVVAHALVETDDPDIIQTVLKNKRVSLEPETVDIVLTRSKYTSDYRSLLVERQDFTPSQAFSLFWWADSETRLRILSRFALSRETIQRALHDLVSSIKVGPQPGGAGDQIDSALALVYGEGEVPDRKAEPLLPFLQEGNIDGFLIGLAQASDISEKTLARIRSDAGGEPLAILCKAGGMRGPEFRALLSLLNQDELGENTGDAEEEENEQFERMHNIFDRLSNDAADLVLRYWEKQTSNIPASGAAQQLFRKRIQINRRYASRPRA